MNKIHQTHFTVGEMPWKNKQGEQMARTEIIKVRVSEAEKKMAEKGQKKYALGNISEYIRYLIRTEDDWLGRKSNRAKDGK